MMPSHLPVMIASVVRALNPRLGGRIVDATLGLGGHAEALLAEIGPEGRLVGIDRDPSMLRLAQERLRFLSLDFESTPLRPKDFVYADITHRLCRLEADRWRDDIGERAS